MRKVLIAGLMLLSAGIVSAQDFRLKFTSKTAFSIGNGSLPAGSYEIRSIDMDSSLFECAAASGAPSVLFEADPLETTPTKTEVTFSKYGDKMVVKGMSVSGEQGYWIPIALAEKRSKKGAGKPAKVATPAAKS